MEPVQPISRSLPVVGHRWKTWLVSLTILGGLALTALAWWQGKQRLEISAPDPDPLQSFVSPYRNTLPEVKYVGDAACAGCHPDQASTYRQHSMGRSMGRVSPHDPLERYDAGAHNPFEKFGFDFLVERREGSIFHRVSRHDDQGREVVSQEHEVQYVLGSGKRGRAYLTSRDNYIFQTPINWFSQKQRWDLIPNLGPDHHNQFFVPIGSACLFCHANHAEPMDHTLNHYRAPLPADLAIGCERCHGPGELHVERRSSEGWVGDLDDTIVNPRRLEPALRESVCQQCHLQGDDRITRRGRTTFAFRPGLPFQLFWSVFVRPPELTDDQKSVSQVEQMYSSHCFRASNGKLGCISCHDPHVLPQAAERISY